MCAGSSPGGRGRRTVCTPGNRKSRVACSNDRRECRDRGTKRWHSEQISGHSRNTAAEEGRIRVRQGIPGHRHITSGHRAYRRVDAGLLHHAFAAGTTRTGQGYHAVYQPRLPGTTQPGQDTWAERGGIRHIQLPRRQARTETTVDT